MAEVKGAAFRSIPNFVKSYGEETYQKWFNALPPESQEIYGKPILATNWYSMKFATFEPINIILEICMDNDQNRMEELGKGVANDMFTGVYKTFLKLGSIEFAMGKFSLIMKTIFRPVKAETVENKDKKVIVRVSGVEEFDKNMTIMGMGFLKEMIRLSGGNNPSAKFNKCEFEGDAYSEWEVT
jgi:hypothetical protein